MIAVLHFNVYAGVRHAPRKPAELSRLTLVETRHKHAATCQDANAGSLEGSACGAAIREHEVSEPFAVGNEYAPAFDADSDVAEHLTHRSQSAGLVVEFNGEILPDAHSLTSSICSTEIEREPPRS